MRVTMILADAAQVVDNNSYILGGGWSVTGPGPHSRSGVCRIYEVSIGDGEWKLWREGEPFSERFTATFSDDGKTITGHLEIAEDGTNYTTDFDLAFRRVGS